MKTAKKTISAAIVGLMCVVLFWGAVASLIDCSTANGAKVVISPDAWNDDNALDKKGMIRTMGTVDASDTWIKVHSREVEVISVTARQRRIIKNRKLVMKKAEELYNANKAGENAANLETAYEVAAANHKTAKNTLSRMNSNAILAGSASFFGVYVPVLLLLVIAYALYQKFGGAKAEVTEAAPEQNAE